jgi:hypothetical protein
LNLPKTLPKIPKGVNPLESDNSLFLKPPIGVNRLEYERCLFLGGVTWLPRDQIQELFDFVDADGDGRITFPEWTSRFSFGLVEAAEEVEGWLRTECE